MATSDTRSGFRLPWSSDRSQDGHDPAEADGSDPGRAAEPAEHGQPAWPESDFASRLGMTPPVPRPADPGEPGGDRGEGGGEAPPAPGEAQPTAANETVMPRKPTRLMAELATAIRATTEAARDRTLAAVDTEATDVAGAIRSASADGADAIRRRSDVDLAAIKEWSKAEIARVREETERRLEARRSTLETELASHAAAVERRVGEVDDAVARYRADLDAYLEGLSREEDPARLAAMAEAMPEPPTLDALREAPVNGLDAPALDETDTPEADLPALDDAADRAGDGDVPRWASGETPEGFPGEANSGAEAGDPVDRGAIMAALEAAAEAVVAAEAAAESADQAEAAADVAETAAELLVGRAEEESEDAEAALQARVGAGGFDTESFTDRLASLLPGHGNGTDGATLRTTQIVVTGLASVASIASFKRHLGRLAGVHGVGVASGPDGEFVFQVSHRADVSFRDAIPTMPDFGARVTATVDGVVSVTARDPDAEG